MFYDELKTAENSFHAVAADKFQIGVHFIEQCLTTSRAHAREPCISAGICAGDKSKIAVALPPLDVKLFADGTVNLHFPRSACQHPRHESAPLVNLCPRAFAVKMLLTGADVSADGKFHFRIVLILSLSYVSYPKGI
jgi:hypothetical protein